MPLPEDDPTHGYQAAAPAFMAHRSPSTIGVAAVRAWARTVSPRGAVLDLGCGHGLPISQCLVEEGLLVHGVDASPTLLAAFRSRFPRLPAECAPVEESAFFGRRFDGVVAWGLIFLLPEATQELLVRRMAHTLVPGGRLLFTAPAEACEWVDVLTQRPSRSLGAERYRALLRDAGMTLVQEAEDEGGNHYFAAHAP